MDKTSDYRHLSRHLPNTIDALLPLAEDVEVLGQEAGWDDAIVMQVNLVLEELIVNAIDNGYPDGRNGAIDVLIETNRQDICIRITDDGDAFDPFQMATPDLSLAIEDRPIGGLGIYLVRSYMDSCEYRYVDHRNQVILSRHL
ncbi:MAG: ATP-binding protein [Methylococcales bacterium]|nr:ATP-binding protein [Methylococcales bacterium]